MDRGTYLGVANSKYVTNPDPDLSAIRIISVTLPFSMVTGLWLAPVENPLLKSSFFRWFLLTSIFLSFRSHTEQL
jgi:hypothetical protein